MTLHYEVVVEEGKTATLDVSPYTWASITLPASGFVVVTNIDSTRMAFSGRSQGREIMSAQVSDGNGLLAAEVAVTVTAPDYVPWRAIGSVLEAVYARDAHRPLSITPFAMTRVLGARFVGVEAPNGVDVVDLRDHVALLRWADPSGMASVLFEIEVPGLAATGKVPLTLRAGDGRRHYVGEPVLPRSFPLPAGRIGELDFGTVHPDAIDLLRVTRADLPVGIDRDRQKLLVEMPEGGTGGYVEVLVRTPLGIVPAGIVVQPQ